MWWLWIAGPIAVLFIYVLTGLLKDPRRAREVQRWKASFGPDPLPELEKESVGYRGRRETVKDEPPPGAKEVRTLPGDLARALEDAAGGAPLNYFELFPKLAYLAVMEGDATNGSDHQTVIARLDKPGPAFTARPLPIVEGSRVPNTGVQFQKDPGFMELYLVEGADAKAIGKWLRRPIRQVLCDFPDLWLRVRGRTMTLTLFGRADADDLDDLVVAADDIFAEVGAEGAPSLLGAPESDDADDDDADDNDDADDDDADDADADDEGASASDKPVQATAVKTATVKTPAGGKPAASASKPAASSAKLKASAPKPAVKQKPGAGAAKLSAKATQSAPSKSPPARKS